LFSISKICSAAVPDHAKPINAYQSKYDMSFFVWKPLGYPGKWYATYDGYPVTEIAKNQWVYGVMGNVGQLTESLTAVGSVDPNIVHILTPLPSFQDSDLLDKNKYANSLKSVFKTKCDNFGIAYTRVSPTPIAWKSGTLKVYMWGGKRWVQISQRPGERMTDTIKRDSHTIANMLSACKIVWTQIDTFEFANYVKNAGYAWIDSFETNMPFAFSEIDTKTGGGNYIGSSSGGISDSGNTEGGGWDTGK
jgi:hypothetical protein